MASANPSLPAGNSTRRVLAASLAGTTIEFFDFYIYANAAILVFPKLFFPKSDPNTAVLESLATFALAFLARPIGSALFGHFGDRIGRKATLVASLLTMGISTVCIGLLPSYAAIGVLAPALLALFRFGQGLGLGGEWGGAVLLATENATPKQRAWFGMFPQLGAPLGLILAGATYLLIAHVFDEAQLFTWGWRLPFIVSAVLIMIGLYVRLKINETPAFQRTLDNHQRESVPLASLFRRHFKPLVLGTFIAFIIFVLFYLLAVFSFNWGMKGLGYSRNEMLVVQIVGAVAFGLTIPWSAIWADRWGRRKTAIGINVLILLFGLVMTPLFQSGTVGVYLMFIIGFALSGINYGPLGTMLSELFPTAVRYTGSSVAFNLAGILGGSLAPYFATWLAARHGLYTVGLYLSGAAVISLIAVLLTHETRDTDYAGLADAAQPADDLVP
jgi:metabolite-proton symporter